MSEATGIRAGLRTPILGSPTDPLVVEGHVVTGLGGWDVGSTGLTAAADRAVQVKLRVGARGGWLAGGPDPLRAPAKSREHAAAGDHRRRRRSPAVRAPPRPPPPGIVVHDGRSFEVDHERIEVLPTGEPVGAEVRLLLSLAIGRIVAEATAGAPSPSAAALRSVLEALQLVAADGSIADAIEQLLHDPAALVGEALDAAPRRAGLATGARGLLGAAPPAGGDDPASVRIADRDRHDRRRPDRPVAHARRARGRRPLRVVRPRVGDPVGAGLVGAVRHRRRDVARRRGVGPPRSRARHPPLARRRAAATPTDITLWPTLDAGPLGDLVVHVTPALFAQAALDVLRRADDTVRPIIDAALAAFGLLDAVGDLRLPVGLIQNPAGWLRHAETLGTDPARLVALVDAMKPLLGLTGDPGELVIVPGVALVAGNHGGAFELQATVDTAQLGAAPPTPLGRLVAGVTAGIVIPVSGTAHVTIDLRVGLDGAGPGRKAIHVALDDHLSVFVRPESGPDIGLYPTGPGIGAAAGAALDAASHALPFLLDKIAEQSGNSLPGHIGTVVARGG